MSNSIEQGFLQAIAAEPDDDVHRLVYADWLEDNDQQPRGEFIRLQCQIARAQPTDPALPPLQAHADAILQNNRADFLKNLPRVADIIYQFRRGFMEVVQLPMSQSKKFLPRILTHAPILQELEFRNPYLEDLLLGQGFVGDAGDENSEGIDSLRSVLESQPLSNVKRLRIEGYRRGYVALSENVKNVCDLRRLEFVNNHQTPDDLLRFMRAEKAVLTKLTVLSYQQEWLRLDAYRSDIDIFVNHVGCTAFPSLTILDLSNNPRLDDEFARLLEQSPLLAAIRIDVSNTLATPERVQRLLKPRVITA